ncbi:hypothetical protein PR048_022384 [Dryococelus australis]|uniref:Nuclease HARBI1 n=1 Tax=Dryococelus australis TaxID=614101 RepID=A0ABQ9H0W7_9NEOP|nr:hypothetical protein PR048_022384 [Dryococelus australis]
MSVVKMEQLVAEGCIAMCEILAIESMNVHTLERKRRRRKWWTKGWIAAGRAGAATFIDPELRSKWPGDFRNMLPMSEMHFYNLLERVRPHITETGTNIRQAVTAKLKAEVTLRYLATGDSFKSLEIMFRVPKSTISQFLPGTCTAIYKALEELIKVRSRAIFTLIC